LWISNKSGGTTFEKQNNNKIYIADYQYHLFFQFCRLLINTGLLTAFYMIFCNNPAMWVKFFIIIHITAN